MSPLPIDRNARQRLRDAQRAEADALARVARSQAARSALADKVTKAELVIATAICDLVSVSGVERTAQLLDEPAPVIRRWVRRAPVVDPGEEPRAYGGG